MAAFVINNGEGISTAPLSQRDLNSINPRLNPPDVKLTKREAECFYLLARVVTTKQIAMILGLSPRTVEAYIMHLKNKMGVSYKRELCEKALTLILEVQMNQTDSGRRK